MKPRSLARLLSWTRDLVWTATIAVFASLPLACPAAPEELALGLLPGAGVSDGREVKSYPAAVDAIVRTMVRTFHLPVPRGKLLVYMTKEDFQRGLVEHLKITPELAQSTARFAKSAVGGYNVLVSEQAIAGSSWPERVELLAHELTHSVQLTLANRPGLARQQWLIEGSAEWMAFNVTAALQLDELHDVRARLVHRVRELRRKDLLPRLTRLDSFDQWVNARSKYGFDGTYSLSFLVTDFLVERHSFGRVADYFRRFEHSDDHLENFNAAFGESIEDFERQLDDHLIRLLR